MVDVSGGLVTGILSCITKASPDIKFHYEISGDAARPEIVDIIGVDHCRRIAGCWRGCNEQEGHAVVVDTSHVCVEVQVEIVVKVKCSSTKCPACIWSLTHSINSDQVAG